MYDTGKIIVGIIIFLVLVLSPFLFHFGKSAEPPSLVTGTKEKECVESTAFMKSSHMVLLDKWRDEVVREGKRVYVSSTGKQYNMSLQNTCMKCHKTKAQFCDRCHDYLDVAPNCWDCHIAPKEKEQQVARSMK
ncbi:MAG: sulfate reduction electron transfer complex DsrMKJOP subunit DsrJ [Pseudomonadota bacterium]